MKDEALSKQMRLEDEAAARVTTESKPCVIFKCEQRLVASVDVRQKERTRQKVRLPPTRLNLGCITCPAAKINWASRLYIGSLGPIVMAIKDIEMKDRSLSDWLGF